MNRRTFALDRVLVIVLGIVLLAAAAWVVVWVLDLLPEGWWSPEALSFGLSDDVTEAGWWTVVLLIGGLVLIAIGGAWLAAHFRRSGVDQLSMPGDAQGGRLLLEGSALADGAARALTDGTPDIVGAKGELVEHRRQLVVSMVATVRQEADLAEVSRVCTEVARQAARTSGRYDLTTRVRLRVASRSSRSPRVH